MGKRDPRLGKVQLEIMQVLWRRGQATAREITDDLSSAYPLAHSTVQTMLRQLEAKEVVAHELEDRTFVFRPLIRQAEVTEAATHDLLARLYGGSVYGLVAYLLRHERVPADELARLRALVEEQEAEE